MSLTSCLHAPEPKPFTFPGIFRGLTTGSLWLANSPLVALRITPGEDDPWTHRVGNELCAASDHRGVGVCPARFEQVATPVTITFNP